jgi:hypothetical protein
LSTTNQCGGSAAINAPSSRRQAAFGYLTLTKALVSVLLDPWEG